MKRIVYGSIAVIALMATSGAMAAVSNDSLTTKGYVDAGLKYVHDEIVAVDTAVNGNGTTPGLAEIVNGNGTTTTGLVGAVGTAGDGTAGSGTGLTGRVEDLELQMQNVPSALQGENGVTISNGKAQITGLSSTTASDGKMYVLKNNKATAITVATDWETENPTAGW